MHRVTRVGARGKPRFAVYGWVGTPEVTFTTGARALRAAFNASDERATAVLLLPRRPGAAGAQALVHFASLPMESVGLGNSLGDFCRFIVAQDDAPSRKLLRLGVSGAAAKADASTLAAQQSADVDDEALCLCVLAPEADVTGASVLRNSSVLADREALHRFVDTERKTWSPPVELDVREPLIMCDMFFSPEIKLFVFAAHAHRPRGLLEQLGRLAELVRPLVRIYIAEPTLCEPVMLDAGLRASDAPTVFADDTRGTHHGGRPNKYRMVDMPGMSVPGVLDLARLRQFLAMVAKKAGASAEITSQVLALAM